MSLSFVKEETIIIELVILIWGMLQQKTFDYELKMAGVAEKLTSD